MFVEHDRAALAALRANVDTLGAAPGGPELTVLPGDVAAFPSRATGRFDIVVADPPYDLPEAALLDVLTSLHTAGLLAPNADLVIERGVKSGAPAWPEPLSGVRSKKYGDTLLCYGRAP